LENLDLTQATEPELLLWLGSARERLQDTVLDQQLKGDIAYNLVADELQRRNQEVTDFDPETPVVQLLLEALAEQQYHLSLTRPSDWEKLVHYAKDGRWDYIGKRFFDRNLHYPALGLSLLGGVVLWGRRRRRRKREATPLP
jgi:LPXTG-motif cell wall-anchored protein